MYLNWFFWGKKSIGRPTSRSHDWLIATSRWVNNPNRSCTQTTSVFTRLRNYRCQNQFITPFTHRVGGWVSQFADSRLARLPRTSFSYFTCHHYLWGKKEIVVKQTAYLLPSTVYLVPVIFFAHHAVAYYTFELTLQWLGFVTLFFAFFYDIKMVQYLAENCETPTQRPIVND